MRAMKHRIAAIVLATAAGLAHGFTVDLKHYRYYVQTPNMPVLVVGFGACAAVNAKKGEWHRGATLHTHPVTGAQFETPGCWNVSDAGATYCMIDAKTQRIEDGCQPFDPKLMIDAATLPRRASAY